MERIYDEIIEEYKSKTQKSKTAYDEARVYLTGGETRSIAFYHPYFITIEKAQGPIIYDIDGNEYIDFLGNYTALIHGNAHPAITEAIVKTAALGTVCPTGVADQRELSTALATRVPGVDQVRFCNSGTEAVMFAIRIARAVSGKDAIIKMDGGYHGTIDIVEYNVQRPVVDGKFEPMAIPDSKGVPKSCNQDIYIAPFNDLEYVEEILKKHKSKICAILVEPMMGVAGIITPLPGYLDGLRKLADKYDVFLIFDEVQSLRLAVGGGQEKYGVIPDITVMGKIIGGGMPIGSFGARKEIMDVFDSSKPGALSQSGTFNGMRCAMAAGVVAMDMLDQGAIDHLEYLGKKLQDGMDKTISDLTLPFSTTRAGSLINLHLVPDPPPDYASSRGALDHLMKLYHIRLMTSGIFSAKRGSFVCSTVMDDSHIDKALEVFKEAMETLKPLT